MVINLIPSKMLFKYCVEKRRARGLSKPLRPAFLFVRFPAFRTPF